MPELGCRLSHSCAIDTFLRVVVVARGGVRTNQNWMGESGLSRWEGRRQRDNGCVSKTRFLRFFLMYIDAAPDQLDIPALLH